HRSPSPRRGEGGQGVRLPAPAMIPAHVTAVRPHDNHARCAINTWSNDDVWCRMVAVVIRARVSIVIGTPDHDVTAQVRIPKTQRNTDSSLSLCDTRGEAKQEPDDDEYAFHGSSWCDRLRKRRAIAVESSK